MMKQITCKRTFTSGNLKGITVDVKFHTDAIFVNEIVEEINSGATHKDMFGSGSYTESEPVVSDYNIA